MWRSAAAKAAVKPLLRLHMRHTIPVGGWLVFHVIFAALDENIAQRIFRVKFCKLSVKLLRPREILLHVCSKCTLGQIGYFQRLRIRGNFTVFG